MSFLKKAWNWLFGREYTQEELEERAKEAETPIVLAGDIAPPGYVSDADEGRPRH